MMVSPDEALLTAAWIVLQAVAGDMQLLASFPVVLLTYQVVAAAAGCAPMTIRPRASDPTSSARRIGRLLRAVFSRTSMSLEPPSPDTSPLDVPRSFPLLTRAFARSFRP